MLRVTRELLLLSSKREDTYIGGISMGGYGAITNGLKNHEAFSKIAMMSPGLDFYKILDEGNSAFNETFLDGIFGDRESHMNSTDHPYTAIKVMKEQGKEIPELFMCCGQDDVLVYPDNLSFVENLKKQDIPIEFIEGPGGHDVVYWNKMLDQTFSFLTK